MLGRGCIVITKFVSKPRMDSMDELVDIELSGFHTGFFAGGGDTWQPMQAPPPPIPSAHHIIHRVVTN